MIEFWISTAWTCLIAVVTILADWIANRLVLLQHCIAVIRATSDDPNLTDAVKRSRTRDALDTLRQQLASSSGWGSDMVTVAIALDLACLSLTISGTIILPFFDKWDTATHDRSLQIWLLLIAAHFLAFLASIAMRHLHTVRISAIPVASVRWLFQRGWVRQNVLVVVNNSLGCLALLSAFTVMQNAF